MRFADTRNSEDIIQVKNMTRYVSEDKIERALDLYLFDMPNIRKGILQEMGLIPIRYDEDD